MKFRNFSLIKILACERHSEVLEFDIQRIKWMH